MRLANYTDNEEMGTREGRIEICINNAWGTVCDNLFDATDAEVFCYQLEGFHNNGEMGILWTATLLLHYRPNLYNYVYAYC